MYHHWQLKFHCIKQLSLWFFFMLVMTGINRDEICRFISLPSWPSLASLQMRLPFHAQSHRQHFWHIFICSMAPSLYWNRMIFQDFSATQYQNHPEPIGALLLGLWEFNNPKSAKSLGCSATLFQACGTTKVVSSGCNSDECMLDLKATLHGVNRLKKHGRIGSWRDERIPLPRRHLWLCYLCLHIFTYLCKALCYQLYTSLVPKPCKELSNGPPFSAESQWDRAAAPALQARPSTNAMPRHVVMLNWCEIVPKSGVFWKSNADKCRIKWSKFLQDRREIPKPDWNCAKLVADGLMSSHCILNFQCWVGCVWSLWSSWSLHFVRALSAVLCFRSSLGADVSKGTLRKRSLDKLSQHWTGVKCPHAVTEKLIQSKVFKSQNIQV